MDSTRQVYCVLNIEHCAWATLGIIFTHPLLWRAHSGRQYHGKSGFQLYRQGCLMFIDQCLATSHHTFPVPMLPVDQDQNCRCRVICAKNNSILFNTFWLVSKSLTYITNKCVCSRKNLSWTHAAGHAVEEEGTTRKLTIDPARWPFM
jgi:hypothetical protein